MTAERFSAVLLEREKQLGADQSSYYLDFGSRVQAMIADLSRTFIDKAGR